MTESNTPAAIEFDCPQETIDAIAAMDEDQEFDLQVGRPSAGPSGTAVYPVQTVFEDPNNSAVPDAVVES